MPDDGWGAAAAAPTENTENGTDAWGGAPADNGAEDGAEETTQVTEENPSLKFETPSLNKDEFLEKARAAGWTETTAFNYDQFLRTGGNDGDFQGAGQKYEWKDEYGDVGPEIPELEQILFGGEFQMRKGAHMNNISDYHVTVEGPTNTRITSVSNATFTLLLHPLT